MLFANAIVFLPEGYIYGGFRVENGIIAEILPGLAKGDVDLEGARVLPGLVDIHIHGAAGADFSDGDPAGLQCMAAYLASCGVTSFLPTSMTLSYERLEAAFQTAAELHDMRPDVCAHVEGIHMEGPFLSEKKKGAHNGAWLRDPDFPAFRRLFDGCDGLVRIVDVAPELTGAEDFVRQVNREKLCRVSVAHTAADYDQAAAVFDAGASHLTHLFNAMPSIHHREPGVIGAACEREDVTVELICDGIHVHPASVRMAFHMFPGRICLISDALRCCGMPGGDYELGGQQVTLKDHIARLSDGTIAGSATNLFECMCNAVRFGIPEEEAIQAATLVPAQVIGAADRIGSIEVGKTADFVVCGSNLSLCQVYIEGSPIGKSRIGCCQPTG